MKPDHHVTIGMRHTWGGESAFGLNRRDRRHHVYCIGKTGSGKTTLLRNLIVQDIEAGEGVGVIDPHGDLAEELLDLIPPRRTDDVVYFNPADFDWPIGFNLLTRVAPEHRHLVASGVVSIFKSIWGDSWGPRLEYILYAAAAALLECENVSLLGIQRMLHDDRYRAWVVKQVHDPAVRSFWLDEFERYDKRFRNEAIVPIQNKVGQLLMAPVVRNILGQVRSKVEPRFMMDHRRILIANLAKGRIGEDKSRLLGSVLVTQFQLAAMSRADLPESERPDFFMFIDEVHNFATDSFVSVLSEARKYRLCLTLSHQYTAQLHDEIRDAVFGNVGTIVAFRVGEADARLLNREYADAYAAQHFVELSNHEICVKSLDGGDYSEPFIGRTLSPNGFRHGRRTSLIRRSREKYATPRAVVEQKITRWIAA